jgi:hypothetical protein
MFRRTLSRRAVFVAALLVVLAAQDGAAQSSGGARRVFAGASAAWNIDNSVSHGAESTGDALAVGLAFGMNFADRWSVQIEGEWPTSDQTTVVDYRRLYDYPPGSVVERSTYRTPTVAVLFGVHWRLPRGVDVAFQFGPSVQHQLREYESQYGMNGVAYRAHEGSEDSWQLGISVGAETAVAVTPRVALVAQVRVHAVPNIFEGPETIARPAVGVRVRF